MPAQQADAPRNPFARFLRAMGRRSIDTLAHIGSLTHLFLETVRWVCRACTRRRTRLGRVAIVAQVCRIGVASIFIVSLVSGAIGFILALQMAPPLENLGQITLVPNIVAVAVSRELGPLIAAIVLIGFAGAAIAAELGTMAVNEEIEALEAHALNPVRFLVVPRLLATTLSLLCLAVLSDLVAIASAAIVSNAVLGIPWNTYYTNTVEQIDPVDFLTGLFKAGVFGALIGVIACGNGLKVTGGAAGVGRATTSTVVESIVAVILADLFFTVVFYRIGWV